jgi:hypothetical protein
MQKEEPKPTEQPSVASQSSIPPVHDVVSLIEGLRIKAAHIDATDPTAAGRMIEAANFLEAGAWQTAIEIERHRMQALVAAEEAAKLERYKYQFEWHLENTRALVQLSQGALRAATLVNAGAAVAILAYLGAKAGQGINISVFANALVWYALGVVLATLATGTAYWSQLLYGNSDQKTQERGKHPHVATVVLYVLAILSFAVGCWSTYTSFTADSFKESTSMPEKPRLTPPPFTPPTRPTEPALPIPKYEPPGRTKVAPPPPPIPVPKVPTEPPAKPSK